MTWLPTDRPGVSRWVSEDHLLRPDALLSYFRPEVITILSRLGLLGAMMSDSIPAHEQDPSNTDIDQLTAPLDPDDDVYALLGNPNSEDDNTAPAVAQDPALG